MKKYAIVGFGCAGYHGAKAIRQYDSTGQIDVYEKTAAPPANPMLTTYYASDKITLKGAYPFGPLEDIVKDLNLNMKKDMTVSNIDVEKKTVYADEVSASYDKILIATGAKAIAPPLKGMPDSRVFVMRTMEDAEKLKDFMKQHPLKRAIVVGASMVGIKLVELFYRHNIKTVLADMAPYLFPLAAYENVAKELEQRLTKTGIRCKWESGIQEITPEGALFSDGENVPGDIICLCIGTRPNLELVGNLSAVESENIDIRRGLVVNTKMETSAADIYAAGDCCEGMNMQTGETSIIGLWANAGYQGETAGKNMAGIRTEYPGNILHNITHYLHTDFIGLGDPSLPGETITYGSISSNLYIQAVLNEGRIQSMNILGARQLSGILKSFFIKQLTGGKAEFSPLQTGLLQKEGIPSAFIKQLGGMIP